MNSVFKCRVVYLILFHCLRSCLGLCKINHILRTVHPNHTMSCFTEFDAGLRHSLEILIHSSLPNHAWQQVILPMCLGGLGFRQAKTTAPSAFISSCKSTRRFYFCYFNYVQTFGTTYFTTVTSDASLSGYTYLKKMKLIVIIGTPLLIVIRRLLQTCHLCLSSLYSHR